MWSSVGFDQQDGLWVSRRKPSLKPTSVSMMIIAGVAVVVGAADPGVAVSTAKTDPGRVTVTLTSGRGPAPTCTMRMPSLPWLHRPSPLLIEGGRLAWTCA